MTKKEKEKEVRAEQLLQKMLICLNTLVTFIIMAVVFVVPLLYAASLWKIYMKSIQVPYAFWAQGIQLDAPLWIHILGIMTLLLLHCYGITQGLSRVFVGWSLVTFVGFFSCRALMRLR